MKRRFIKQQFLMLPLIVGLLMFTGCKKDNPVTPTPVKPTTEINFKFAAKAEGQQLMQGNTKYYATMTQNDIDWRVRKENSTLDELKAFAQQQVLDFTDSETALISKAVHIVEDSLNAIGCHLPIFDNIVFIKTTMEEEKGASAYTIKNQIFIGEEMMTVFLEYAKTPKGLKKFTSVIAHELFHCITRNSPSFRQKMYSLIGFTVMDHDIAFPENIKSMILQNPDVEHIDNYAEFTINGVKRQCELVVLYSDTWAEASAKYGQQVTFFQCNECVLVPLDEPGTKYPISEAEDFWDRVGLNTDYVMAPEECMADNFSYAVAYGFSKKYKTPELIRNIISTLKTFK